MICSKCGAQNPDDANFCIGCGAKFVSRSEDIFSASYSEFGGFWERFLAWVLDNMILGFTVFAIMVIIIMIIDVLGGTDVTAAEQSGDAVIGGLFFLFAFVLAWFYFTILESSPWQATPGKKALNLIVTDLSGDRISFGRANGRFWSKIISGMILYIGYIIAAFTEKKQALHDLIAGTLVIKKK